MMMNPRKHRYYHIVPLHEWDEIAKLRRAGKTFAEIGEQYKVTRERIRQIIQIHDPEANQAAAEVKERKKQECKERNKWALLMERARTAKPCVVCGYWALRGHRIRTCSPECAEIWRVARYHLNEEYRQTHRISVAKWMLKAARSPQEVEHAKRVLAGKVELKGRWTAEGSKAGAIVGRYKILYQTGHLEYHPPEEPVTVFKPTAEEAGVNVEQ